MLDASSSFNDIVFSCHICQACPSVIYGDEAQSLGFNQAPITKLYLTDCGHVICAKHFDGGGESGVNLLRSSILTTTSQLKAARDMLQQLGQDVIWIDEALLDENTKETGNGSSATTGSQQRSTTTNNLYTASPLMHGVPIDLANLNQPVFFPGLHSFPQQLANPRAQHFAQSRSDKRKRLATSGGHKPTPSINDDLGGNNQNVSRAAMPPPQLPARATMPVQAPPTHIHPVRSSSDGSIMAWTPSVSNRPFNSQHEATSGLKGTSDYLQYPSYDGQSRAAKVPKHAQASTQYKSIGQSVFDARQWVPPIVPRTPHVPGTMIDFVHGQGVARPNNDGELDHVLHRPTPQRPRLSHQAISPTRGRITLPPTPRNTHSSNTGGQAGGRPFLNQGSLFSDAFSAQSGSTHRQQLGQLGSASPFVAQSPYFTSRNPSPELPALRQTHGIAQHLQGPPPVRLAFASLAQPASHQASSQRQGTSMASDDEVSYLGQQGRFDENSMGTRGGRRRARR
ncbi:MAG: hypothetical protein Q9191_000133 [Dirinaria sp. TL-2023a]